MKISVLQVISTCTVIKKMKLDVIDDHAVSLTLSSTAKLQPVIFLQSIDGQFDVIFERKIILRINSLQNSSIQSHFHLTRFKTNLDSCSSIESQIILSCAQFYLLLYARVRRSIQLGYP